MDFNNKLNLGKEFKTKVMLDNNNDQDIDIKTWSYVYRGSKSYSGEREENMDEFTLKANSLQIVELSNIVKDITPGNYKLKVLVNKDNQKTNNEITKDITIGTTTKNIDSSEDAFIIEESENNKITNNVVNYGQVYESSTEKTKNLAPLFIITLSVLLNIALIWKR
jgi:outer membrane usher protein FimD/PapC